MATIDRRSLNFAEVVAENFGFLSAHRFRRVHSEPTLVRFESKRAYVNVYHGRKSFELNLEIGPPARPEEAPYSMEEIIRLMEPDKLDEYRIYATRTVTGVEEGVQLLAAFFRRYVDAGLLDDVGLLDWFQKQREAWSRDFALK